MIAHRLLKGHRPLSAVSVFQGQYSAVEPFSAFSVPSLKLGWLWSPIAKAILLGQVHGLYKHLSWYCSQLLGLQPLKPNSYSRRWGMAGVRESGRLHIHSFCPLQVLISFEVSFHPTQHSPMILPPSTKKQSSQVHQCLQANGWKNSRLPGTEKPSH